MLAATRRFAVVQAPSALGLRAAGVECLGDACSGMAWRWRSVHAPSRPSRRRLASGIRDPASGVLNGPEVAAYVLALAVEVVRFRDSRTVV